ncbi:MAG: hypothetical protein DRG78_06590 [Epsilonproteobacteria bacterium]|nr:MAG: hypothetical protein DRG78_06590 [Campylobacterota bacterium]
MESHISILIFEKWLQENIDRFNIKPILLKSDKESYTFMFEGVIKNITLVINTTPETIISFNDNNLEYIDHYEIAYISQEKYNPEKGFYDSDRIDDIYTYFPTREELYINEVFEVMLKYCNKILIPENSLYLSLSDGATSGFIKATDNKSENKNLNNLLDDNTGKELYSAGVDNIEMLIKYTLFDTEELPVIKYFKR